MEKQLGVTLVANAGLLLEYEGTTLLLDGIYGREGHPFSNLAPAVWEQMLDGKAPFGKVDYLLFSHAHPDHFSMEMTEAFLLRHRVKGVFLPDGDEMCPLLEFLNGRGIPAVQMSKRTCRAVYQVEPEISIQALPTLHLDKKYEKVQHVCYLLQFGEKKVLFTADADYIHETFDEIENLSLRAVFVNPLFFSALRHERFFKGVLHTKAIGVYHVPFPEDDTMGMRLGVARNLAQWPSEKGEAFALWDAWQRVEL